jgi:hypothetical protein
MGQLMKNAKIIGRKIVDEIRQIADDEDTEVDGWLEERDGRLVNARGEVVGTFGSRA